MYYVEYSVLVGQILYLANNHARCEQKEIKLPALKRYKKLGTKGRDV
jgi:hypothetical protein